MRHQYTPVFRDILTSRIWAQPHSTVRVWLWFEVSADPEGYVSATLSGVAVGARVSLEEAREAVELLCSVDPDAPLEEPFEGRLLERVPRGYRVLNLELDRERARHESHKARNRRYMVGYRKARKDEPTTPVAANDGGVTPEAPTVDAPKPIPKPKPSLQEEGSPQPPEPSGLVARFVDPGSYERAPTVIYRIPEGWQLGDELREEARIAGVQRVDEHFARLKTGPIGGSRGVFAQDLADYVRGMFGKWRAWEETDRAKALAAAARPSGVRTFQPPAWEPNAKHRAYAQKRGLDLAALLAAFTARNYTRENYSEKELNERFGQFMSVAAKGVAA